MSLQKTFSQDKKKCSVTFIVSQKASQNAKKINLAGDFNSWSSTDTSLEKNDDGSFSVTLELDSNREYQFRYLLDGIKWENDWDADKYIPAPFSNADNSVVVCSEDFKKQKK